MAVAPNPLKATPLAWLPVGLRESLVRRAQAVGDVLLAGVTELMPKGLYARALIIIIAPIVMLEGVIAFVFMERHWQTVSQRLAESTARDIAALVELYDDEKQLSEHTRLIQIARDRKSVV